MFFGARSDYLTSRFPVGATVLIHGQLDRFGEQWQIAHPELLDPRQPEEGMLPVYRLVQGLGQRRLRALLRAAIVAGAGPARVAAGRSPGGAASWPSWNGAIASRRIGRPTPADLEPRCAARRRLACDELARQPAGPRADARRAHAPARPGARGRRDV